MIWLIHVFMLMTLILHSQRNCLLMITCHQHGKWVAMRQLQTFWSLQNVSVWLNHDVQNFLRLFSKDKPMLRR